MSKQEPARACPGWVKQARKEREACHEIVEILRQFDSEKRDKILYFANAILVEESNLEGQTVLGVMEKTLVCTTLPTKQKSGAKSNF